MVIIRIYFVFATARQKQLADLGFDIGSSLSTVSDPEGLEEFDDSLENLLDINNMAKNKPG